MDTERKIYGLLETVEQQQKSLEIAAQALEATRVALRTLVDEIHSAATQGASGAAHAAGLRRRRRHRRSDPDRSLHLSRGAMR